MRMHWGVIAVAAVVGCGGKPRQPDVTANRPSLNDARGKRVSVPAADGPTTPLTVDWTPEQRTDLEVAAGDGIIVVRLDDKGLSLVPGCQLEGHYGYVGVGTKKELVQLKTAQQVAANLPLTGGALGVQLGAAFERGASLDVSMAIVGKHRTTWQVVARGDLRGEPCKQATHFVRGLTVGAFTMKLNASEKAKADLKVLGAGTGGGHDRQSQVDTSDGVLAECDKADPQSGAPPAQCRAVIRLQLDPIADSRAPAGDPAAAERPKAIGDTAVGCGGDMVFVDGRCAEPIADRPHACRPDDEGDCTTQCQRGEAVSCERLAAIKVAAAGKVNMSSSVSSRQATLDALEKACKLGSASGCARLGMLLRKTPEQATRAIDLLDQACIAGESLGCREAGLARWMGERVKKNVPRALVLLTRGCDAGDAIACTNLAVLYSGADGIPRDEAKALALSTRACEGGIPTACGNVGLRYEMGMEVKRDIEHAARLFQRACEMSRDQCVRLAILYQQGEGVPRDPGRAQELYAASCDYPPGGALRLVACHLESALAGNKPARPRPAEVSRLEKLMRPQCQQGSPRACSFLAVAELATGRSAPASQHLSKACDMGDGWACTLRGGSQAAR